MSVKLSFVYETELPQYQREAIDWLEGYAGTTRLQDFLRRFRFAPDEIEAFRAQWAMWLKPKAETKKRIERGIH